MPDDLNNAPPVAETGMSQAEFEEAYQRDLDDRCNGALAAMHVAIDGQDALRDGNTSKTFHALGLLRVYADRTTAHFIGLGAAPYLPQRDPEEYQTEAHGEMLEKLKEAMFAAVVASEGGGHETIALAQLLCALVYQIESARQTAPPPFVLAAFAAGLSADAAPGNAATRR